ncbi:MAG: hypothetical protein ABSE53_14755 [Terracidiphilus sp.]|jgi:hypothetical protein
MHFELNSNNGLTNEAGAWWLGVFWGSLNPNYGREGDNDAQWKTYEVKYQRPKRRLSFADQGAVLSTQIMGDPNPIPAAKDTSLHVPTTVNS